MKIFLTSSFLLFFVLFSIHGFSQTLDLKSKSENIEVFADSSFVKHIEITLDISDDIRFYPIVYDTELEKVSEIKLFVKKGKRLKEVVINKIHEEDVELDYITSKKIKSIEIPTDAEVTLTYQVSCTELMYFSSLHFFSYNKIDSLKYTINVPNTFDFVYNTIYKDTLDYFKLDSIKLMDYTKWKINVTPQKVEADPLQFFGIYKNMKVPLMRTMVMPKTYDRQATKYMNDWYMQKVSKRKGLSPSVKHKIDQLTDGVSDPKKLISLIYGYVKSNFKYVAIEIGMGAFIPTHANEVFTSKQGDCKDLSNFLSEALEYKGVSSDIALAATFDHISDCDFPSLSSANHVICIAYIDGKTILLDPTDPIHIEETPIQSLQNRTILIVNKQGGLFYKAKRFTPVQNEIAYQINLKVDTKNMILSGPFDVKYHGISGNFLQRELQSSSLNEVRNNALLMFEEVFGGQTISDIEITKNTNEVDVHGQISIYGKTFEDGSNQYLFIDFLPRIMETESRETLLEGTYLRNPFLKTTKVTIEMDHPIEKFKTITHAIEGDGVVLNFSISTISERTIYCEYDFEFDHIFIENDNMVITNKILKLFKKITNEPIVFKKKSI